MYEEWYKRASEELFRKRHVYYEQVLERERDEMNKRQW